MDKESAYKLQLIDCNCNDCKFMVRDLDKYNQSLELHKQWQEDYFNNTKNNLIKKAEEWKKKGEDKKAEVILKEVGLMRFVFDKSYASISFGKCEKFNKAVTFIPNVCQIDTQDCFQHRRTL